MMYEFVGFDEASNREQWRHVSWLELHTRWIIDVVQGDRCARCGYKAWVYCRVTSGPLLPADMLDWNMEVIR